MNDIVEKIDQQFRDFFGDCTIRVDRKQMINQLRAMSDNYVQLSFDTKNKTWIQISDRYNSNRLRTRN